MPGKRSGPPPWPKTGRAYSLLLRHYGEHGNPPPADSVANRRRRRPARRNADPVASSLAGPSSRYRFHEDGSITDLQTGRTFDPDTKSWRKPRQPTPAATNRERRRRDYV